MTLLSTIDLRCGLCRQRTSVHRIQSWFCRDGSLNLDLIRPGLPRGLRGLGLEGCSECGYLARDLSERPSRAVRAFFAHQQEQQARRHAKGDGAPCDLEVAAHLAEWLDRPLDAFLAYRELAWNREEFLQSPWTQRDSEEGARARAEMLLARLNAAQSLARAAECTDAEDWVANPIAVAAVRADLLRRARAFEPALALAESALARHRGPSGDEDALQLRDMLALQVRLCRKRSAATHTVYDAYAASPDHAAREAAREAEAKQREARRAAEEQAARAAVAPLRLVERLDAASRGASAGATTDELARIDPALARALTASTPSDAQGALRGLPLPASLVSTLTSCAEAYHWPAQGLLVALAAALAEVIPTTAPRLRAFLDGPAARQALGVAHRVALQPYLVRCLRETTLDDWHYAAPRVADVPPPLWPKAR